MEVDLGGDPKGPLAGIRIADFSAVVSGPLCSQILGDLGADVVKVETPRGDFTRLMGPPFHDGGQTSLFSQFNRNKRSLVLDLKRDGAVEVAKRLAGHADVLIENYRPGVADRLGIGYETLSAENAGLVYVAISGFGPDGPYAQYPAYDSVIQGLSGFMQVQGDAEEPRLVRGTVADKSTAMTAAYATLAALFARERNGGRGQRVDVPMLDAYAAFALSDSLGHHAFSPVEEPPGGGLRMQDLHRTWRTADGHVVMMVIEDAQFFGVCRAIDREDLIDDPRCANILTRIANAGDLFGVIEQEIAKWSTAELVSRAREFGAPMAPANGIEDFMADPQVQANGTVFEVEHEEAGTLRQIRNPARFSENPTSLRRMPPSKGQHSDEVLRDLGYGDEEIRALREGEAVA